MKLWKMLSLLLAYFLFYWIIYCNMLIVNLFTRCSSWDVNNYINSWLVASSSHKCKIYGKLWEVKFLDSLTLNPRGCDDQLLKSWGQIDVLLKLAWKLLSSRSSSTWLFHSKVIFVNLCIHSCNSSDFKSSVHIHQLTYYFLKLVLYSSYLKFFYVTLIKFKMLMCQLHKEKLEARHKIVAIKVIIEKITF